MVLHVKAFLTQLSDASIIISTGICQRKLLEEEMITSGLLRLQLCHLFSTTCTISHLSWVFSVFHHMSISWTSTTPRFNSKCTVAAIIFMLCMVTFIRDNKFLRLPQTTQKFQNEILHIINYSTFSGSRVNDDIIIVVTEEDNDIMHSWWMN